MGFFRFLACAAPLLSGFGVAAALAFTRGLPARRRAAWTAGVHGAVLGVLLLASFADSPAFFPPLAVLLSAFALLVAAVHLLLESFGARRELCQLAASLVVALLVGSVFLIEPVLENAARVRLPADAIGSRITLILSVNPFMTTGLSILGQDLLHWPAFYRLDLAAYQHAPPRWGASALGYAVAALVLGAAAALRRRFARPA
jgi:hypothetical protein